MLQRVEISNAKPRDVTGELRTRSGSYLDGVKPEGWPKVHPREADVGLMAVADSIDP